MTVLNLEELCQKSRKVILETGDYLREQKGKVGQVAIEEKERNHLVSYVDRTAEKQLVKGLSALIPESTFLTEEGTVAQEEGVFQWIIDPLDGTTNFLHQIPIFSISVALRQNEKTVLGIVYEVNQDECFYAWKDGGAFLNDTPIKVSSNNQLEQSLLATGLPYYDHSRALSYFKVLQHFTRETRGLRRMGSAAVDLAYVACGRFDAYFEYSISPWDIAAGAFIVQEAGGISTDFQGNDDFLFTQEIIASSSGLYAKMLKEIKPEFYS